MKRCRLRDLGITIGRYPTGPCNAITDVRGVRVGHTTLISGEGPLVLGKGPVRTGVTAVVPADSIVEERLIGGAFVLNGAGEVSGVTQLQEWGVLETPILLTNTLAVGKVADATVKWLTRRYPQIGREYDVIIPVVGECDDSFLNDAAGRHIRSAHVYQALETAASGPVAEGAVGAGTGMMTCDFKAGIGTASRRLPPAEGGYTVGVLVQSNFGHVEDLRVNGAPIGPLLLPEYRHLAHRRVNHGSIIAVVATDTPLLPSQVARVCKRAALGIGRVGSIAAHGSGEIIVGFSTANKVPRNRPGNALTHQLEALLDRATSPVYEAVIEATEEAILNSLCMADALVGRDGHYAPALPLSRLKELMARVYARLGEQVDSST
jgi:D-aminopeptidase